MCLAKLACPTPTIARTSTATVTGTSLPAKPELHAQRRVCALLENRSLSFSIGSKFIEYHNANSSQGHDLIPGEEWQSQVQRAREHGKEDVIIVGQDRTNIVVPIKARNAEFSVVLTHYEGIF